MSGGMKYLCVDGPLKGSSLWLITGGTLPFVLGGFSGYYRRETGATLQWVPTPPPKGW